ncbi:hypothetical protein [Rhodococcoides fascians]|uniref:hypothetical protein n=1 Tax=Rhodococcoides fascians TaxID=1828 RepID=UPI00056B28F0|nr:hypothetical protein [Rhodococcus fascians]
MASTFGELAARHIGEKGQFSNQAIDAEWYVEGRLRSVRHYVADNDERRTEVVVQLFDDQEVTFSIASDKSLFVR